MLFKYVVDVVYARVRQGGTYGTCIQGGYKIRFATMDMIQWQDRYHASAIREEPQMVPQRNEPVRFTMRLHEK